MEARQQEPTFENSLPARTEQLELLQAKSHYRMALFSKALPSFQALADKAWAHHQYELYVDIILYIIRILLEQERNAELPHLVSKLEMILKTEQITPAIMARAQYTLGILNLYFPHGSEIAKEKFQQSIGHSLVSGQHDSLAYGLYGLAAYYFEKKEWHTCLLELDKLDQILHFHANSELTVAGSLLRGFVHYWQDQCKAAVQYLQAACEELKHNPNNYLFLRALNALGSTHLKMKDYATAHIYLELGKFSCPPEELPLVHKLILKNLNQCRQEMGSQLNNKVSYDPVQGIMEREGVGVVSFQTQFILRDLLNLLVNHPGEVFSKEDLVKKIWKENYSPLDHDNKIYVTLKRLRQALEPIFPDVESILRHRNGYTFNQQLLTQIRNGEK